MIKENKIYLDTEEVTFILNKVEFFQKKNLVINLLLKNNIPLTMVVKIQDQRQNLLNFRKNKEKIQVIFKIQNYKVQSNKELISFLKLLEDRSSNSKPKLFLKKNVSELLKTHLKQENNTKEIDFSDIKQILILIQNKNYFGEKDLIKFLKKEILEFGFDKCIELLLVVPDIVPKIIYFEIKRMLKTISHFFRKLSVLLNNFPENIQNSAASYVFSNQSDSNLKFQIDYIAESDSLVIKEQFKNIFKNRLLNENNPNLFEKTMNYLQEKFKNNNQNHILFEIITGAPLLFSTSDQELMQVIISKPKKQDFIFSFFKNYDKNFNYLHYNNIKNFLNKIFEEISNRSIMINTFEIILDHNEEERLVFFKYFKYFMRDSEKYEDFSRDITNIGEDFVINIPFLKNMIMIYKSPLSKFPEVSKVLEIYNHFLASKRLVNLQNFIFPREISSFPILKNFPLKSLIYKNCILRKATESRDYMQVLISSKEDLNKFLVGMINLEEQGNSIEKIEIFFSCIDTHFDINNEIQTLTRGFPNIFNKNPSIEQTLKNLLKDLCAYRKCYEFISFLDQSLEVLGLPIQFTSDYKVLSTDIYNSQFSAKLKNIKIDFLDKFDQNSFKSLILLFKQISESKELVILMSEIKEHEYSMWHEFFEDFDNTEKIKRINFTSIKNFSNIWSFFNVIKNSRGDLISYFRNILHLMNIAEYMNITEIILECNPQTEALEEFNSTLITQEHLNLYKIKMINQNSKIAVKGR